MASSSSWVKHSCRDRDIYHAQVRKTGPSPERGLWVVTNIYINIFALFFESPPPKKWVPFFKNDSANCTFNVFCSMF